MAKLRLFSAAFPWQCELPDAEGSWTFGFSQRCSHQLPQELKEGQPNLAKEQPLFTIQGSGKAHWEVLSHSVDEGKKGVSTPKLNGKSLKSAALGEGDILTLGSQGHILVSVAGKRARKATALEKPPEVKKAEPAKKSPAKHSSGAAHRVETEHQPKQSPNAHSIKGDGDFKKPPATPPSGPKEKKEIASKKSPHKDLINTGGKETKNSEADRQLPPSTSKRGRRAFKVITTLLVIFSACWLYLTKAPDFERDVAVIDKEPSHSEIASDEGNGLDQSSPVAPSNATNSMRQAPSEQFDPAEPFLSESLNENTPILGKNPRADSWPILIASPTRYLNPSSPLLQERLDLSSRAVRKGKSPITQSQNGSSLEKVDSASVKARGFWGKISIFAHAQSESIAELATQNRLVKWVIERRDHQSDSIATTPKRVHRALLMAQLRSPLGPPISIDR